MANLDLIDEIVDAVFQQGGVKVFISKVAAHTGVPGNERADTLAKRAVDEVWAKQEINKINRRNAAISLSR